MFRSFAIRAALLCLAVAPFAPVASAQLKVGVVDTQKALAESDDLKKQGAAVEAKYKPRQDEINKLQADLQSIEQQLNSGKLNQQAAAELQAQGTRKQRDLQRLSDDLQQDFERPAGNSGQGRTENARRNHQSRGGKRHGSGGGRGAVALLQTGP